MGLASNFKSKKVRLHLLISIVTFIVVCVVIFWLMSFYTKHGQAIPVPKLIGLTAEEANAKLDESNLEYIVSDSLYNAKEEPGTVLDQDPKEGSEVKSGRKVYLTICVGTPPVVEVPDLNSFSEREAKAQLAMRGLVLGKIIKVPEFGSVFGVMYMGKLVPPGTKVPKGTILDLKIGQTEEEPDSLNTETPDIRLE